MSKKGQESITFYEVLDEKIINNSPVSIVKCKLKTGRTHQIRVHLSYIGHQLLGDTLYGTSSNLIDRQALHCNKITFIHPITRKKLQINCNLPFDMQNILK